MAGCVLNIPLLGSSGVGKSALAVRLCNNEFLSVHDPTVEDTCQFSLSALASNLAI